MEENQTLVIYKNDSNFAYHNRKKMIYPDNFEIKIGFQQIRKTISELCLSELGAELCREMTFTDNTKEINKRLQQCAEYKRLEEEHDDYALGSFFDGRSALHRIKIEGTHLEEQEVFELKRTLESVIALLRFLNKNDQEESGEISRDGWRVEPQYHYPQLHKLAYGVIAFPKIVANINTILDSYGRIKDNASANLSTIRTELARMENVISKTLSNILRKAQREGLVESGVSPTLRDGRLVIPIAPGLKRKISGIVHDESASGRTVFVEPTEVVEANNKIRELENEERQEIIRILTEFTKQIRPYADDILKNYVLLAQIDLIQAKTHWARNNHATTPHVENVPKLDWRRAFHPLLSAALKHQNRQMNPLNIELEDEKHILIISGPNAGGKSVCLKTVGLLQYMLQCGVPIPIDENSICGTFSNILIDIGDEQSLENDLSTYSSHLLNMKTMMRQASEQTLILIDEFGTGTEPGIGGALAEAVLEHFCMKRAWAVITTHYQNLKYFADNHEGVVNGAMLYDRHEMKPLFQLEIGRPGSSFAVEIARKIGLPEEVIRKASDLVGQDYIQSDKYLQDIVRDKRYWENKRLQIHQKEKDLEKNLQLLEKNLSDIELQRKQILNKAKQQAEELFAQSNKKIENAIRDIRKKQAEKEETKRIRKELELFKQEVQNIDTKENDDAIQRKIEQIQKRKERRAERKANRANEELHAAQRLREAAQRLSDVSNRMPVVGDSVRIKGLKEIGKIESIQGEYATAIFGGMHTKLPLKRLELATEKNILETQSNKSKQQTLMDNLGAYNISHVTRETMDERRKNFRQDLDIRGFRGDEALLKVRDFIDDAILVGMQRVRILHGKGNGILRQLIREYLSSEPAVSHYADEHVQFGGAGITVVDFN